MERIKWLCSKALLHVCAFMDMDCASPTESLRTHKNIFIVSSWGTSFYHADFPPLLSQRFWRKNSSILPSPPPYLLKSHFIKVMDSTSNKIATAAIIARHWRHAAGRTKYHSPFNVYDLQNLLQVHTVIKGGGKSIFCQVCAGKPPGVCIWRWLWISVISPHQIMHLSLNFTFAFQSEEGNEHWQHTIRAQATTGNKASLRSRVRRDWEGQAHNYRGQREEREKGGSIMSRAGQLEKLAFQRKTDGWGGWELGR